MIDLLPAVSYRRVSTVDQESGYSLAKQLDRNTAYAAQHNLDIIADYAEDISGITPIEDRPQGSAMLDMLRSRRAVALVVCEADRLSRDIVNLLATVQKLLRSDVQIHIGDVGQVKSELDILLIVKAWQGGSEHAKILDRTMSGKLGKASSGKWVGGTPPLGYRREGWRRDTRMVIHDSDADTVRDVFRWYVDERLSMLTIADRLNAAHVPTQRGGTWAKNIVKKIISNETYIGVVYYSGIRIDLPELAIIDRATFERAQELRRLNRERASRNRQRQYLLANLIRCSCGETMTGSTQPGPHQRIYYRCSQFQWPKSARTHTPPFASGYVLEDIVWRHVETLISDDALLLASAEALSESRRTDSGNVSEQVAQLDRAIAQAVRRIDRLLREFGADADEDVVKATRAAVRDAQRERDEARTRRAMLLSAQRESERSSDTHAALVAQAQVWRALIPLADWQFKRDVLLALDCLVTFGGDAVTISTALSLPVRVEYMTAWKYKRSNLKK